MSANDTQVAGDHYRASNSTYQHWDMVVDQELNYFEGQITKYVMRCRRKKGLEDLLKAKHFIEKYIEVFHKIDRLPVQTKVEVVPWTQDEEDRYFELQEEAKNYFQPDGFATDGTAGYQCVWCRKVVRARSPLGALRTHGSCHPRGTSPLKAPDHV